MANIFDSIKVQRPPHSTFDLSHDVKTTLNMGKLVPIACLEALPGDVFNITPDAMFRMQPMINPIMHPVDITMHAFFVPNRIIWDDWNKFIFPPNEDTVAPVFPTLNFATDWREITVGSLADYMGLPLGDMVEIQDTRVSALPFAAYQAIFGAYYRDQNLDVVDDPDNYFKVQSGTQSSTKMDMLMQLRTRAWEHDYFTAALPWAQKGAQVTLPLDISGTMSVGIAGQPSGPGGFKSYDGPRDPTSGSVSGTAGTGVMTVGGEPSIYDPNGSLIAVASPGSNTLVGQGTINDLRTSYALQKWLEKNARGGTRPIEGLRIHFGVRSSDARLQRPEYIGGTKSFMAISEVLQTSSTVDDTTPQGNMAGHGISLASGNSMRYRTEEHGHVIVILSIRPRTAYMQGLARMFTKFDKLDYYWPDFAFLGEQAILNKELFLDLTDEERNEEVFGYIPRYSEYRYMPSRVSGEMRTSLIQWHMARDFDPANPPVLNDEFVQCVPTKRIYAVEDQNVHSIICHIMFRIFCTRPLPKYGNPGSI